MIYHIGNINVKYFVWSYIFFYLFHCLYLYFSTKVIMYEKYLDMSKISKSKHLFCTLESIWTFLYWLCSHQTKIVVLNVILSTRKKTHIKRGEMTCFAVWLFSRAGYASWGISLSSVLNELWVAIYIVINSHYLNTTQVNVRAT